VLVAEASCAAAATTPPQPSSAQAAWHGSPAAASHPTWSIRESQYRLQIGQRSNLLTIANAAGTRSFSVPLAATVGSANLPRGVRSLAVASGQDLTVTVSTSVGAALVEAVVIAQPTYFTVSYSARLGTDPSLRPGFFADGRRGLAMASVTSGYSPDPGLQSPTTRTPATYLGVHPPLPNAPFAPAPYDVELQTPAGWLGIGLVQLPDARRLEVTAAGAVVVDYPLPTIGRFADHGGGGTVAAPAAAGPAGHRGTWLAFPAFVLTVASGWEAGVTAYGASLRTLGQAPVAAPPGHRPSWWYWPIVDTWGQQQVTDAARRDDEFTASWVRHYVSLWRQRFGVGHFTVIIDAQWQKTLGNSVPSSRFGGVAGMQKLIDQLHAQGLRVLLWWPLWVAPSSGKQLRWIDPTAPGYAAHLEAQISQLVGNGPTGLHADGLKLDWGAMIPPDKTFRRPQLGIGAAALYRYMAMLSADAWRAQPTAVIDASAMAPQYGGLEDLLRLYDASAAETWSDRATIVSAADPLALLDGDGWKIVGPQAIPHLVQSAIFGTPAVYYATRWSGGAPIDTTTARALGALMLLTATRGQGAARPYHTDVPAGDDWGYYDGTRLLARSLSGAHAAVVYQYIGACSLPQQAVVVSVARRTLSVPLPPGSTLVQITPGATATNTSHQVSFSAKAGVRYLLRLRGCIG